MRALSSPLIIPSAVAAFIVIVSPSMSTHFVNGSNFCMVFSTLERLATLRTSLRHIRVSAILSVQCTIIEIGGCEPTPMMIASPCGKAIHRMPESLPFLSFRNASDFGSRRWIFSVASGSQPSTCHSRVPSTLSTRKCQVLLTFLLARITSFMIFRASIASSRPPIKWSGWACGGCC